MPLWPLWLVIAIAAAIGEVLTMGLYLAPFALAAAIAALTAIILPPFAQAIIFVVLSAGGLVLLRPFAVHALGLDTTGRHMLANVQPHIVGRQAIVTRTVDGSGGQIRIGEGEFWSARSYNPDDTIPAGQRVEVMLVDGVTALVAPLAPPALTSDTDVISDKGGSS
jgi:membrane protein implicated in regulation of membrane protease activity